MVAQLLRGQLRHALKGIGELPGQQNQGCGLRVRFYPALLTFLSRALLNSSLTSKHAPRHL
jgi:hypothetical protein